MLSRRPTSPRHALGLTAALVLGFAPTPAKAAAPASALKAPVVQLLVEGVVHEPGATIVVEGDRPVRLRARLMDGYRSAGLNPAEMQKAGKGKLAVTRSGEWGFAYVAGGVTTEMVVARERAEFGGSGLASKRAGETEVEVRLGDSAQPATLEVAVELLWRTTVTGPKFKPISQDSTVRATGRFQIKRAGAAPAAAWFSSKYVRATGQKSDKVERVLTGLQQELDALEKQLAARRSYDDDLRGVSLAASRLSARLGDLEAALARDRAATPPVVSVVTLVGLPTDGVLALLDQQQRRADRLSELWTYCQGRKAEATEKLLQLRQGFAANVVRSVFKNYLTWLNGFFSAADLPSIPTGLADLLMLFVKNPKVSALDKPRGLLETWTAAIEDSSVLLDQRRAIALFEEAERFFQERMDATVAERREALEGVQRLRPLVERVEAELKKAYGGLKLARVSAL